MTFLQEVEDVKELKQLSKELRERVSRQANLRRTKTVGFPSGRADFRIHFASRTGEDVVWWASQISENGEAFINLVGRGNPDSRSYLSIDLQFNIPIRDFSRRHGGAFVRDVKSGAVYLAHRGIATRGNSRVPKDRLIAEADAQISSVASSTGPVSLFLVAEMDSPTLLSDISEFAHEMRRAADVVMGGSAAGEKSPRSWDLKLDANLGQYFDEFSGERSVPARKASIALVRHGQVVKRLTQAVHHMGSAHKSALIDLVINGPGCAYVFEVKTSLNTASIYTAIGQLFIHSLSVAERFKATKVRKVLVIPGMPSLRILEWLRTSLGIEVLSYVWKGTQPEFDAEPLASVLRKR